MQDFHQTLQEIILQLSCKILARFFISCKKSFIFSVRLARYVQDLVQDLASLQEKYLQDLQISCKMVFTGGYQVQIELHSSYVASYNYLYLTVSKVI